MEIIIAVVVIVAIGAIFYFNRDTGVDVNKDGKVDLADVKAAVTNTVEGVKTTADVNKDGKVDAADAKAAGTAVKKTVKKAATKARTAVKKAAPKK